jgi:preprotein translocase subunit SecY
VLSAFGRAFRTPDLRKKLLFTLGIMALFRVGSHVPAPGVDTAAISQCIGTSGSSGSALGLINLFSGNALLSLSIFALGIMPYITASIILQLLTVVIPRLDALKKEGQAGQTKITQYTRYLTIGLAILQATGLIATGGRTARTCSAPPARRRSSTRRSTRSASWSWSPRWSRRPRSSCGSAS